MASFLTHLAVAKEYLRKNPDAVKDVQAFYDGSVISDLASDKDLTHSFFHRTEESNMLVRLREKINLDKFASHDPIGNDLGLGIFLHLLTDKVYYEKMFTDEYLLSVDLKQFQKEHGQTMSTHESFIGEHFDVSFDMTSPQVNEQIVANIGDRQASTALKPQERPMENTIFSQEELLRFIDEVSSMDLQAIISQIKNNSQEHEMSQ